MHSLSCIVFMRSFLTFVVAGCFATLVVSEAKSAPTFNKNIAPIVFSHCSTCHRPGQVAPFPLLNYDDVKKHSHQIADVTSSRSMPPWLPEPGHGEFLGARLLSSLEIDELQEWVSAGSPEGDPADLSPGPVWSEGWQLGEPDLVVTMPKAYTVAAEGEDVYRNFVVPVPLKERKFIKAVEFRPDSKAVHHAFIKVDRTPQSRHLAEQNAVIGFPGMRAGGSEMPSGQFLSWQPGATPSKTLPGLAWVLDPGNDIVLQLHMIPSGRPEQVQPQIGLYFTSEPPTNTLYKFELSNLTLDIPPGATNYIVRDSYRMPVDVDLLAVLPHTHYLGRRLEGTATLPDGTRKSLLLIKEWDFDWQGDYRYVNPVFLPAGTLLEMNYSFDNSTNNVNNPNHPPKPVAFGPQSSDEMAELWFQVLPRKKTDRAVLDRDYQRNALHLFLDLYAKRLAKNPKDIEALTKMGQTLMMARRYQEAEQKLRAAISGGDSSGEASYFLAVTLRSMDRDKEAMAAFEEALRMNPGKSQAHGYLGYLYGNRGDLDSAERHFRQALKLDPSDQLSREGLQNLLQARAREPNQ